MSTQQQTGSEKPFFQQVKNCYQRLTDAIKGRVAPSEVLQPLKSLQPLLSRKETLEKHKYIAVQEGENIDSILAELWTINKRIAELTGEPSNEMRGKGKQFIDCTIAYITKHREILKKYPKKQSESSNAATGSDEDSEPMVLSLSSKPKKKSPLVAKQPVEQSAGAVALKKAAPVAGKKPAAPTVKPTMPLTVASNKRAREEDTEVDEIDLMCQRLKESETAKQCHKLHRVAYKEGKYDVAYNTYISMMHFLYPDTNAAMVQPVVQ